MKQRAPADREYRSDFDSDPWRGRLVDLDEQEQALPQIKEVMDHAKRAGYGRFRGVCKQGPVWTLVFQNMVAHVTMPASVK
jgi:hypothetical protein